MEKVRPKAPRSKAPACTTWNMEARSASRTARKEARTRNVEGLPRLGIPSTRPARSAARKGGGGVMSATSKLVVVILMLSLLRA